MKTSVKIILAGLIMFLSTGTANAKSLDHTKQQKSQLKAVYDSYFSIKDALIKGDSKKTTAAAKNLHKALEAVDPEKLSPEEKSVWLDTKEGLFPHTEHIEKLKMIEEQRLHFSLLTENIYKLMKVSKFDTPIYYQYCPMYNNNKGGYWLSKDNKIKNPYYGTEMMNCGSTVETLQ